MRYASKLQALGVRKGDIVAIHLDRSRELIFFQLAVIIAGAIFLPVDKRYPDQRIRYMCDDCGVKLFITDSLTCSVGVEQLTKEKFMSIPDGPIKPVENDGVCYIIYTSGSTGKPKGCMLTAKGLLNFCLNNNTLESLKRNETNRFACVNSVSFDYFIAESLLPLLNGYSTVILDDVEGTQQRCFLEAMEKHQINVLMTTPTRLKLFFDDAEDCGALTRLDAICTSGEPLTVELLNLLQQKSPRAQIYNPLGPSECTVWNAGGKLSNDDYNR